LEAGKVILQVDPHQGISGDAAKQHPLLISIRPSEGLMRGPEQARARIVQLIDEAERPGLS
jgi:hypothetical protein